jgi:hypothetical protein
MGAGALGKGEVSALPGAGVSRGACAFGCCGVGGGSRDVWRRGGIVVGGGMCRKGGGFPV